MIADSKNKKQSNKNFTNFITSFVKKKYNLWVLLILLLTIFIIFIYYAISKTYSALPNNNSLSYSFFNDSANGGNSELSNRMINDTLIQFDLHLKNGFLIPYVGVHIKDKKNDFLNLQSSNQITLDIYTEGLKSIGLYLYTNSDISTISSPTNEIAFFHSIKVVDGRNTYTSNINEFKVPDWFLEKNSFDYDAQIKPNMNKVTLFNITTAYPAKANDKGRVEIHALSFERDNTSLILFLILSYIAAFVILLITQSIKQKISNNTETVTIAYKAIKTKSTEEENQKPYLTYISNNFTDSELTLESVSNKTNIGQRVIANEIQKTFGCNFKTYINEIRINESKRLLIESDLNIGEIAYKVGFNNQSHFNRVFKSSTNTSPGKYREQQH